MEKTNILRSIVLKFGALVLAAGALMSGGPTSTAFAVTWSAGGTHQCKAADGSVHTCVVSGTIFGDCVSAGSSLQTQDCCPSTQTCSRDSQGRQTCQRGGTSTGFTLTYCIQGR